MTPVPDPALFDCVYTSSTTTIFARNVVVCWVGVYLYMCTLPLVHLQMMQLLFLLFLYLLPPFWSRSKSANIYVQCLDGKIVAVQLPLNGSTVADVKETVRGRSRVPVEQQLLVLPGQFVPLHEDAMLADCRIGCGSMLVVRLAAGICGGMPRDFGKVVQNPAFHDEFGAVAEHGDDAATTPAAEQEVFGGFDGLDDVNIGAKGQTAENCEHASQLAARDTENARLQRVIVELEAKNTELEARMALLEQQKVPSKADPKAEATRAKKEAAKAAKLAKQASKKGRPKSKSNATESTFAADAAADDDDDDDDDDDEHRHADLPAALESFKIISDHPAVIALTTGEVGERGARLEKAVQANPSDAAAVEELAKYSAELIAATKQAIETYLKDPGLFKRAFEALEAGNSTFLDVYSAVWNLVEVAEPQSLVDYKRRVTAAVAKLPKKKQQQTTSSVAELFRDGAVVKPLFDAVVSDKLYKRLKSKRKRQVRGAKLQLCPTLKKTTRIGEKVAFALTAAGVSDVVRGMFVVKSMAGVDAVLEMLLELETEGVLKIVRLKDRFCALPSGGGWRDLMANITIVGDETNHICELQVVHEQMLTAREGLPGHAVYDRVRNAVELLAKKFGSKAVAGDAVALATVLVGMGGGDAVGQEGGRASSWDRWSSTNGRSYSKHHSHVSGKDVFLADKGWLSDAPLEDWMGVRVDARSGRVTHVELKGKGLVGPIPKVLADLTELEHLDLRDNKKMVRPAGLEPSKAYPTGDLGLLDMTGQVHYTTKERCQAFLQHLKQSDKEQRMAVAATQLVSRYGPDGPALWKFFKANEKFPGIATGRWFQEMDAISKWNGVITETISSGNRTGAGGEGGNDDAVPRRVVGLKFTGFRFKDGFAIDGLNDMLAAHLAALDLSVCDQLVVNGSPVWKLVKLKSLNLDKCQSLTTLPSEIGQLVNLASLDLFYCSSLTTLPSGIGRLVNLASLNLSHCKSLTTLPSEIGLLVNLASLNLYVCESLKTLPSEIGKLVNLVSLNLASCLSLTTLPSEIGQLVNLASLNLHHSDQLVVNSSPVWQLVNLTSLNLASCSSLKTLPSEIGQLVNLASLNLRDCSSLTTLPCSIGKLVNIASLDLKGTFKAMNLRTLPSEIGQLVNLASLNLNHCSSLTTLPSEIGQLVNLASLDLDNCSSLTTLPSEIGQLVNLAYLDLNSCPSLAEPFPDLTHILPTLKFSMSYASAATKAWVKRGCTGV